MREGRWMGGGDYFDSAGGCCRICGARTETCRESDRPRPSYDECEKMLKVDRGGVCCHALRKRMTDATTPTLKPIPLRRAEPKKKTIINQMSWHRRLRGRTILRVNPPLAPRTYKIMSWVRTLGDKGGKDHIRQRSYCASSKINFCDV